MFLEDPPYFFVVFWQDIQYSPDVLIDVVNDDSDVEFAPFLEFRQGVVRRFLDVFFKFLFPAGPGLL